MPYKTMHRIKPTQNFEGISPRGTSQMHYCTLHACCRLSFLEAWLQLDQLKDCIQHPSKTVLWKQVLLGLQQGTKLTFYCRKNFCEVVIQRWNKCQIWPKCLMLAAKPMHFIGVYKVMHCLKHLKINLSEGLCRGALHCAMCVLWLADQLHFLPSCAYTSTVSGFSPGFLELTRNGSSLKPAGNWIPAPWVYQ